MSTFLRGNEPKVLIFIDEAGLAEHLARSLEGRLCLFCEERENPIQRVYDEVPHLIVIDEDFHAGRGRDIALLIKEDIVLRHIPIMLLSRHEEARASKDALRIDCFLRKDHPSATIVDLVNDLLERSVDELDLNPLTRLPGFRSSLVRVERAVQSKDKLAIIGFDVPGFHAFSLVYGSDRADELVLRVGKIIQEKLAFQHRSDAFLGHLGSDDFMAVVHSPGAVAVAEEIIRAFDRESQNFHRPEDRARGYWMAPKADGQAEKRPFMTLTVVIVHNDSVPLRSLVEVGRIAGQLKRYLKEVPRSGYIDYSKPEPLDGGRLPAKLQVRFPASGESASVQSYHESLDRTAAFFQKILKEHKIRTVYQPIADLKKLEIVGYEALTRAISDYPINEATLLFAIARQTDCVKQLDRLCVEFALKAAQKLAKGLHLSLNLNVETLLDGAVVKDITAFKGRLAYEDIVIEVTEQSLFRSFDKVRDALEVFREAGASVAIDDVGGGAVSLRDVAILKPNYIKFDRSLIRQIDTSTAKQQIVMSLNKFADGIGAKTVAEGIETPEEMKAVLMCGADLGQGYYLARPGEPFPKLSI